VCPQFQLRVEGLLFRVAWGARCVLWSLSKQGLATGRSARACNSSIQRLSVGLRVRTLRHEGGRNPVHSGCARRRPTPAVRAGRKAGQGKTRREGGRQKEDTGVARGGPLLSQKLLTSIWPRVRLVLSTRPGSAQQDKWSPSSSSALRWGSLSIFIQH
jgi:hypothetical protein